MRSLPFATLAITSLVCLAAAAGQPCWQSEGVREAKAAALRAAETPAGIVPASLSTLGADPAEWLGRQVSFEIQMHSPVAAWNPYLTRFGTEEYLAVRVWADEQMLWDKESFEKPAGVVFARRGSAAARELSGAPAYARFAATAKVEQVFGGRPWIEVTSVERLPEAMTEGAILHASRALQAMAAGEWRLAADDLSRALASWPPPAARAELETLLAECRERL